MNTYEEKREKLALMLIDLHNKLQSLGEQAAMADGHYNEDIFSFEIIDRVVAGAYAIIKADVSIFGALDTMKRRLMLLNAEKQKLLTILAMSYNPDFKNANINQYRQTVRDNIAGVTLLVEQVERSIKEKFGIVNPYRALG